MSRSTGRQTRAAAALAGTVLVAALLVLSPATAQTVVNQIDEDINPLVNVNPAVISVGPVTDSHNSATSQPNTGPTETAVVNQVFRIDNDILIDAITGVALVADIDNTNIDFTNSAAHNNFHNGSFSVDLVESADIDQTNEIANAIVIANGDSGVLASIDNDTISFLNSAGVLNTNEATTSANLMQSAEIAQTNRLANAVSIADSGGAVSGGIGNTSISFIFSNTGSGINNVNEGTVGGSLTQSGKIAQANILFNSIDVEAGSAAIGSTGASLSNNAGGAVGNFNAGTVGLGVSQTGEIKQANIIANRIHTKGGSAAIDNASASLVNNAGEGINNNVDSVGGDLTQTGTIKQANVIASRIDTKDGNAGIDNANANLVNAANGGMGNINRDDVDGGLTQTATIKQANVFASSIGISGGSAAIVNQGVSLTNQASDGIDNFNAAETTVGNLMQTAEIAQANVIANRIDAKGGSAAIDNQSATLRNTANLSNRNFGEVVGGITQSAEIAQANIIANRVHGAGSAEIDNHNATLDNQATGIDTFSVESAGLDLTQTGTIKQTNFIASHIETKDGSAGISNRDALLNNNSSDGISNFNGGSNGGALTQSAEIAQANVIVSSIDTKGGNAGIDNGVTLLTNIARVGIRNSNEENVLGLSPSAQSAEIAQANLIASNIDTKGGSAAIDNGIAHLGNDLTQSGEIEQANTLASTIRAKAGSAVIDNTGTALINDANDGVINFNQGGVSGDLTQSGKIDQANTLASRIAGGGDATVINEIVILDNEAFIENTNDNAVTIEGGLTQEGKIRQSNVIASLIEGGGASAGVTNDELGLENGVLISNVNTNSVGADLSQAAKVDQANTVVSRIDDGTGDTALGNRALELSNGFEEIVNENEGSVGGDLTQKIKIEQANTVASVIAIDDGVAEIGSEAIGLTNIAEDVFNINSGDIGGDLSQSAKVDKANTIASLIEGAGPGAVIETNRASLLNLSDDIGNNNGGPVFGDLTQTAKFEQANTIARRIDYDGGSARIGNVEELLLSNDVDDVANENFNAVGGNLAQKSKVKQTNVIANSIAGTGAGAEIGNDGLAMQNFAGEISNANEDTVGGDLTQTAKIAQANIVANRITGAGGGASIVTEGSVLANSLEEVRNSNGGGSVAGNLTQRAKIEQANVIASHIAGGGGTASIQNVQLDLENSPEEIVNINEREVTGDVTQFIKTEQANIVVSSIDHWAGDAVIGNEAIDLQNDGGEISNDNSGTLGNGLAQKAKLEQVNVIASSIAVHSGGNAEINNQGMEVANNQQVTNTNSGSVGGDLTQSVILEQANKIASNIRGDAEIDNQELSLTNESIVQTENRAGVGGNLLQSADVDQANTVASSIVTDSGNGDAAIHNRSLGLNNLGVVFNSNDQSKAGAVTQSATLKQANVVASSIDGDAEIGNEVLTLSNNAIVESGASDSNIGGDLTQSGDIDQANIVASEIVIGEGGGAAAIANMNLGLSNGLNLTNESDTNEIGGSVMQSAQADQKNVVASSIDAGSSASIANNTLTLGNNINSSNRNTESDNSGLMQSANFKQKNVIASSIRGDAEIGNEILVLTNEINLNNSNSESGIGGSIAQSGKIDQANVVASSIGISGSDGGAAIHNRNMSLLNTGVIANTNGASGNAALSQSGEFEQANVVVSDIDGDAGIENDGLFLVNDAVVINLNINSGVGGALAQSADIDQFNSVASKIVTGNAPAEIANSDLNLSNGANINNSNTNSGLGSLMQSGDIDQANVVANSIAIDGGGYAKIGNVEVNLSNTASSGNNNAQGGNGSLAQSTKSKQANTLASRSDGDAEIGNEQINLGNIAILNNTNINSGSGAGATQSVENGQANDVANLIVGDGEIGNANLSLRNGSTVKNSNTGGGIGGDFMQSAAVTQTNTVASSIRGDAGIANAQVGLANSASVENENRQGGTGRDLRQALTLNQANEVASLIDDAGSGDAVIDYQFLNLGNSADIANINALAGSAIGSSLAQSVKIDQANTLASRIDGAGSAQIGNGTLDLSNDLGVINTNNNQSTIGSDLTQSGKIKQANTLASSIADIRGDANIHNEVMDLSNEVSAINDNNESGIGDSLTQSLKLEQANTLANSIDGAGSAGIDNYDIDLRNSAVPTNNNGLNGANSIGSSLTQSTRVDQANTFASSIDGAGSARIGNAKLGLTNTAQSSNSNTAQSPIGTDLTQSGKIKQANTVASSIVVDGKGSAEIDNEALELTNFASPNNVLVSSEVEGNIAQSAEIDQANRIASSIAGDDAKIDNKSILALNSGAVSNTTSKSPNGGDLTQSGKIKQANTLASSIDGDAEIDNEALKFINSASVGSSNSQSAAGANLAQSFDVVQANTVASFIGGEGNRAQIDNKELELGNDITVMNSNGSTGVGAGLTQDAKIRQANVVASSVDIANSGPASKGKAGVRAKIDTSGLLLQNSVETAANDNITSGVGDDLTQEMKVDQANTVASSIGIDNSGDAPGKKAGVLAKIETKDLILQNGTNQVNSNSGGVGGDLTQSIELDQANIVANDIGIANSGDASGGEAGILAKIENKNLTLQNGANVTNTNSGGVGGALTQSLDVDQTNIVASNIDIANSGTASGKEAGILAKIENKDLFLQNGVTGINANSGGVGGGTTLTAQVDQVNTVASSIRIDNSGTAEGGEVGIVAKIDNENLTFVNAVNAGTSITQTNTTTSDIEIINSGSAYGGALGIYASHEGESTRIFNSGKVSAGSNFAIDTVGASTWLYNQSGGVILGYVDLTDNADSFMNEAGSTFDARMTSDFRNGDDLFDNHGLVQTAGDETAAEFTNFVNLETFNNGGTISLVDGMEGDVFRISNTFGGTDLDFNASSGSTLAVDAFLGGPGSTADNFIIDGDVTGVTTLQVNNTAPGMGVYNPDGIPVVFVNGDVSAHAFDVPKPIDAGLFDYDLFYVPTGSGEFELRSFPGGGAHVLPQLVTAAQDIFHTTNETWLDRTADLRVLLQSGAAGSANLKDGGPTYNSITPGVWVKGSATWLDQDGKASSSAYGRNYSYNLGRDLNIGNVEAGIDFGTRNMWAEGDALVFGVLGGAIFAELDYDALARKFDVDGGEVGVYATYLNGGLYVDNLLKVNFVEFDPSANSGLPGSLDSTTWGFRTDAGYRFGTVGQGVFIEPQGTIAVAWSEMDNFTLAGNRVSFSDETDVRGRLGLRLGTSRTLNSGMLVEPFVIGSVWGDFSDENSAAVTSLGTPFGPFKDEGDDVWGVLSAGINGFAQSGRISGFGKVDVIVGDETDGVSAKGGVRYNW